MACGVFSPSFPPLPSFINCAYRVKSAKGEFSVPKPPLLGEVAECKRGRRGAPLSFAALSSSPQGEPFAGIVNSIQKSRKHHGGICGVFCVDKCLWLRYNTPKLGRRRYTMMKAVKTAPVCPTARITRRLDTAEDLVVSVPALRVRITVPTA